MRRGNWNNGGVEALVTLFMNYCLGNESTIYGHSKESKPSKLFKRNKNYQPHQGAREKARRVRQGLAGLNCDKTTTLSRRAQ